jgi:streptomycin 6-kinase
MQIPHNFILQARTNFGEAGVDWVNKLPNYISRCQRVWRLIDLHPAEKLSINMVYYARSKIFGDVVLKLQGPHAERRTEIAALQLLAGHEVCRLHAVDQEISALLLERILPGSNLRALKDKNEQLKIGAELVAQLPVQPEGSHDFPTYCQWINNATEIILPQFKPDQRLFTVMMRSEELFNDISPPASSQFLLHGDLHHDNILRSDQHGWKVIDPHGVIGPRFMESARFIQNHIMEENNGLRFEKLNETVSFFAWRLARSKHLIGSAVFILHALSTCWDVEMNFPPEQVATRIDECEILLKYLNNLKDWE